MAEVVMDDMAIGNSASPLAPLALVGLVPQFPIAQFQIQVIAHYGQFPDAMQQIPLSVSTRGNRSMLKGM
jgi:hypothetical protein